MSIKINEENKEEILLEKISKLENKIKQLKEQKRYGLVWENKPEKFEKESENALPVLIEKGGKYKDIITNKNEKFNILIEGDNYHSLSVLAYTHRNKIDVIYIDPPYNTGNKDFIYNDHYVDKEDRFRHSKWLSFMEKRLKIAKTLLKKDGVIFISIDDNEQAQLKLLCDSIFGEKNFINCIIWYYSAMSSKPKNKLRNSAEYILLYGKSKMNFNPNCIKEDKMKNRNIIDITQKLGKLFNFSFERGMQSLGYEFDSNINDWYKWYTKTQKDFFKNDIDSVIYNPVINRMSKEYIKNFDGQKPTSLIKTLLKISSDKYSIILDFFAGSGTTGQAVLELNKEESGDRKFILCTNNENNICERKTFERIKKVIRGSANQNKNYVAGLGGNIKYLKTDFIKLEKSADSLKQKMVNASTEILCLKENTFSMVSDSYKKNRIKIFQNSDKYTAILFDLFYLDNFIEELKKLKDKPVAIYVFSYTKEFSKEEFRDLDIKFTIEPIPEKILETYKKIFNF